MLTRIYGIILFASLAVPVCTTVLFAEDTPTKTESEWPQFRGPRGDGIWHGPRLPETWPATGLKQIWKQSIGGGYAGISVAAGRVITMDRQVDPEVERVLCFEASSGKTLWKHEYRVTYGKLDYGNGPRAQPTIHDGLVYTVGALGDVRCLTAETGSEVWKRNYLADFNGRLPTWGFAGSPVVYGDCLILQPGGEGGSSIVALDRWTGKDIWRSLNDEDAT